MKLLLMLHSGNFAAKEKKNLLARFLMDVIQW